MDVKERGVVNMIEKAWKVIALSNEEFKDHLETLTAKELEELRVQFSNLAKLSSSKNSLIYHFYRRTFK